MKLKKILHEIANSGIIPLIVGVSIIFIESNLTDPSFVWMLFGFGFVILGLFLGDQYMNEQPSDNPEKEPEQ